MNRLIMDTIKKNKIIVIARGIPIEKIIPTALAVSKGGIRVFEITLNQNDPEDYNNCLKAINMLSEYFDQETLLIGAGTVLSSQQVEDVYKAGARFVISPNVNKTVIEKTKALGMVSIPGAFTPTEACDAYDFGADFVKLFPAGVLGIDYIKQLRAPLSHIPFLAVGGVTPDNIHSYMDTGIVGVGIGGGILNKSVIENQDYMQLTQLAKNYTELL